MALELTCPSCGGRLRVGDEAAGKQIRCGRCQTVFRVPPANLDPPPPPPPPPPPFELVDDEAEGRPRRPVRRPRDEETDEERPRSRRPRDDDEEDERPRRRRPRDDDEDDEDDRPRRRRRYPRESAGRGALFWVAVAVGGTVFALVTCCGGGYALLPGEQWRRHESAAGGFAVDIPGPVKENMQLPGMRPDPNIKVEGTTLWKRGELYVVAYADLPGRGPADAMLDGAVSGMRNDPGVKRVVRNERITVSGFPAREVEYLYNDGGTYVARIVISNRRLYIVIGGGRFVRPNNANIRRFLDTFSVTDQNPRR